MGKKRSSAAEDLMDLIALLPWWVGVSIALVLYLVLHSFAAAPPPNLGATPSDVVSNAPRIVLRQLASIAQYVVPLLCLLGALGSLLRRRKRTALIQDVSGRGGVALDAMSWREFEWTVSEAFRLQGYGVSETGGGGPDGGIDLVLRRDGKTFLVQCKQRRRGNVDVPTVRELAGVMNDRQAQGAFIVTSGRFTAAAEEFAGRNNIELLDRDRFLAQVPPPAATLAPVCPRCRAAMVKRQARNGANAGAPFWGCSTFPKCRGTVPA
jgi:restriction system protein